VAISKSGYVLSDFRQNDHRMSVRENITFFSGTLRICSLPGGLLERVFWQMQFHVFRFLNIWCVFRGFLI